MATFAQALEEAVVQSTDEFTVMTRGGVDLGEVFGFLFTCLGRFMDLARQYQGTPEADQKRLILSSLRRVYRRTNPDIPLLPEPIETFMESLLLQTALPAAYAWLKQRL